MVFTSLIIALGLSIASTSAHPHHKREIKTQCNHDFSFTYDDGPLPGHTGELSTMIKNKGGLATFYMNGNNYRCIYDDDVYPIVKQVFNDGHQIASHTWSHKDLQVISTAEIDEEIIRLDEAFIRILGIKPRYIRPPYGSISPQIADYIERVHGKVVVTWDDDSGDSGSNNSAQGFIDYYTQKSTPALVGTPQFTLNHDTLNWTYDGSEPAVTTLLTAGHHLVTTAQCMDDEAPYVWVSAPQVKNADWDCSRWVRLPGTPSSTSSSTTPPTSTPTSTATTSASSPPTTCLWTYTSVPNDNCDTIAEKTGMTVQQLLAANSFVTCGDIWSGTPICVTVPPRPTTTTTQPPNPTPTCAIYYWSRPGERTCSGIEDKLGMETGQLAAANPWISCSDIWDWTGLCIPPNSSSCSQYAVASTTTTCQQFGDDWGLNKEVVLYWNPWVNCEDIWQGTQLCVRH